MRVGIVLVSVSVWLPGCRSERGFPCDIDAQCVDADRVGMCQATGFCSFPDPGCPSGQRYGEHAGDGLDGRCVPEPEGTGDDTTALDTTQGEQTSGVSSSSESSGATTSPSTSMATATATSDDTGATETETTEPLDPDLVAWYRFEDPLDDGAEDSTSHLLHGLCDSCPTQTAGVHGNAALFDGVDQFIELPSDPLFELTDELTVAAWARFDAWPAGARTIVGRAFGDGTANSWELIAWVPGNLSSRFLNTRLHDGVDPPISLSHPLRGGSDLWHHVAVTWDGEAVHYYVDGDLSVEGSIASVAYDDHVARIGADSDAGEVTNFIQGAIDDVRIYRRALAADEIAELAAQP